MKKKKLKKLKKLMKRMHVRMQISSAIGMTLAKILAESQQQKPKKMDS